MGKSMGKSTGESMGKCTRESMGKSMEESMGERFKVNIVSTLARAAHFIFWLVTKIICPRNGCEVL